MSEIIHRSSHNIKHHLGVLINSIERSAEGVKSHIHSLQKRKIDDPHEARKIRSEIHELKAYYLKLKRVNRKILSQRNKL